jgi:hypothetical protein
MHYIANYLASDGAVYSCPLQLISKKWMLATAHGPREFTYELQESASPSGWLTFHELTLEAPNLRPCDFADAFYRMKSVVPVPQKPPEQLVQKVNAESDSMPSFSRLEGESDRVYFQRIALETDALDRKIRTEDRRTIQSQSSPSRKQNAVANAAKTLGEEDLRLRRPRGRGGYVEVEKQN